MGKALRFLAQLLRWAGWSEDRLVVAVQVDRPQGTERGSAEAVARSLYEAKTIRLMRTDRRRAKKKARGEMTSDEWLELWPAIKRDLEACMGVKYRFGAEVDIFGSFPPDALDCSELVELVFNRAGIPCPDGSFNQFKKTYQPARPRPGDLGFFRKDSNITGWNVHGISHVGILVSDSLVIEARGKPFRKVIGMHRSKWEASESFGATGGWRRLQVLRGT